MSKWRHIFKAGDYPQGKFTGGNIDAIVSKFNKESAGVPITIDHKKTGVAYGWVDKLKRQDDYLCAEFKDIPSEFAKVLEKRLFNNVSVEIAPGDRLRAVSFLGAKVPQIKELDALNFNEDENIISIDFEEHFKEENMNDEGLEKRITQLEGELKREQEKAKEFSEQKEKTEKELKSLKEENALREKKVKKEKIKAFCEKQIKEGKLLPAELKSTEEFMDSLDDTKIMEFSEDDKVSKKTQLDKYIGSNNKEKVLEFKEVVNDKAKIQYNFTNDGDSKQFSEVKKRCKERNIALGDKEKVAGVAVEVLEEENNDI